MRGYPLVFPEVLRPLVPGGIFRVPVNEKVLYLTFDDGPTRDITHSTLDILRDFKAHATFFLIGNNIDKEPGIVEEIEKRGHRLGSHTQNHVNGWRTRTSSYMDEVRTAASKVSTDLFRPPYGRIKWSQATQLREMGLKLIMWDVISGDFDLSLSGDDCARIVIENSRPGSIVVFHDSQKGWPRLSKALPRVLEHFTGLGYRFEALPLFG